MTIARMGLKVKVMDLANAFGLTSVEGNFFWLWFIGQNISYVLIIAIYLDGCFLLLLHPVPNSVLLLLFYFMHFVYFFSVSPFACCSASDFPPLHQAVPFPTVLSTYPITISYLHPVKNFVYTH